MFIYRYSSKPISGIQLSLELYIVQFYTSNIHSSRKQMVHDIIYTKHSLYRLYFKIFSITGFFFHGPTASSGSRLPHFRGFMITLRHTTLGTTPLDGDQPDAETSTWQHTKFTRKRDIHAPPGFEPTILASECPQTHTLDREATGIATDNI